MNTWPPDDPALLVVRYLTGELSEREEVELLRVLEQDPAQRQLYEDLQRMWQHSRLPVREWDVSAALKQIKRTRVDRTPLRVLPLRRPRTLLRLAASLVVLVGSAALWRVVVMPHASSRTGLSVGREFSAPRGRRVALTLPDGTRLVLAAESRARVPAEYGRRTREVYLEGEAIFDVVHDAAHPFRVRAKDAVAEDVGTRFDVRAYDEDSVVAVAVAEGVVALRRADTSRHDREPRSILQRGDVGTLAPDGRVMVTTGAIAAAYFAWSEGRLRFFRAPLSAVARTLSRWYDLDVRIEGQTLASVPITAEFAVQSADEVARELALATGAEVKQTGKVITLHPKP